MPAFHGSAANFQAAHHQQDKGPPTASAGNVLLLKKKIIETGKLIAVANQRQAALSDM
jgi:hypothetical protein